MARIVFDNVAVEAAVPGHDAVPILQPFSATWNEQSIALIGANGSGKSTLARLINGLVSPTAGRVLVDDLDVQRDGAAVRRRVGFMFTDPKSQFAMPTAIEDVALSLRRTVRGTSNRRVRAAQALERFGLADHAEQSVHSLSGGQQQLLALAGVLATHPDIVVADEPTTLLDLRNARLIGDTLLGLSQQLVLVTHDLDLAQRCERAMVLCDGVIVFDGMASQAVQYYRQSVASS